MFILAAAEHIRTALSDLRRMDQPVRRVMIAGGGNIGLRLARGLGEHYQIKLIEADRLRCDYLASQLDSAHALVLNGDCTNQELLTEEGVDEMDLFVALTSDDENNIMACMLAKRMGARRTIALINRQAYADLVEGNRIDVAIVPAQATIGQLLKHVRGGDVVAAQLLDQQRAQHPRVERREHQAEGRPRQHQG